MILDLQSSASFIDGYKKILLEIYREKETNQELEVLARLAVAREHFAKDRTLLQRALAVLTSQSVAVNPEVVEAINGLELKDWIYLRDTKIHSIFIDQARNRAYGVLGLINRIRDVIGGTGALLETGLVRYRGRFVCDGIVSRTLWLGPNYRRDFNAAFSQMKTEGLFHARYEA